MRQIPVNYSYNAAYDCSLLGIEINYTVGKNIKSTYSPLKRKKRTVCVTYPEKVTAKMLTPVTRNYGPRMCLSK